MEFQEVVRRRRMHRRFTAQPVAPEAVDRMLGNAVRAPSAGFSQGWAFVVLDRAEDRDRFWAAAAPSGDGVPGDGMPDPAANEAAPNEAADEAAASDPAASGPAASDATASGPAADSRGPGPRASGPRASGPRASGPARSGRDMSGWLAGMRTAPVLVLVLTSKEAYLRRYAEQDKGWADRDESRWPVPYWHVDAGMAALLILQTAVDDGLGACFFGVPPTRTPAVRAAFDVPGDHEITGVVAVGHPATGGTTGSPARRARRPLDDVVHRGRFTVA